MYIALIGDIIGSKQLKNRHAIQEKFKETLIIINEQYQGELESQLTITLGDEFQGLFKRPGKVLEIIDKIKFMMAPTEFRFGIGAGEIDTVIQREISIGADGSAYWNARLAIDQVKDENDYQLSRVLIQLAQTDEALVLMNDSLKLCDFIESRWRTSQRELMATSVLQFGHSLQVSQLKLGEQLGITSQAVNQRIQSSGYYPFLRMKNTIAQALEEKVRDLS